MENVSARKRNHKNKRKHKKVVNLNVNESAVQVAVGKGSANVPFKDDLNSSVSCGGNIMTTDQDINDNFLKALQKKMEFAISNGGMDLPNTLLGNLQKLIDQEPVSDIESSDDENEYIEYVYKPRQYFAISTCNFCKADLRRMKIIYCSKCMMTSYCQPEHMKLDEVHRPLCYALRQIADNYGGHIFYKCGDFTPEQFRSYRIIAIRKAESILNRQLTPAEQEVLLFPRICCDIHCREYRFDKLIDCQDCGMVSYCKDNLEHLNKSHHLWCKSFHLFKELIMFQEHFGKLDPSLPTKILKDLPLGCGNMRQICSKLSIDIKDDYEYAALSQIATGPLTAWYALKLCDKLRSASLTVHLIGAEVEFEVDLLHKWELFFLHITPSLKELNIVFIGPELNSRDICYDQLKRTKSCRYCRKSNRIVKYHFEYTIYHTYSNQSSYMKPDLICFFNPGLYRSTGFQTEDTWPETIEVAAKKHCPVVVTSYTQHEAPLDLTRFIQECNRHLDIVLPPTMNPFTSIKPERNFISDEEAPLMYKNHFCFVVE